MSGQQAVLQVVIMRDGLLVGTEVLIPGKYAIGSSLQSDLRLDDASVGARHAVLYFQNGKVAIQDAGSATGVYVNGHRVTACQIRSVDELICGPFVLKARVLSQQPAADEMPPEVAALLDLEPQAQAEPPAEEYDDLPLLTEPEPAFRPRPSTPQATVPSARARATGERPVVIAQQPRPSGERAAAQLAQQPRPSGERAAAQLAQQPRPSGERAAAQLPQQPRPSGERAAAQFPQQPRPSGERAAAQLPQQPRPSGERAAAQLSQQPRPSGERSAAQLSQQPRPSGERAAAQLAQQPRPSGERAAAQLAQQPRLTGERAAPMLAQQARNSAAANQLVAPQPPGNLFDEVEEQAQAPRAVRDTVRASVEGKGKPNLHLELYWGEVRCQARSFAAGDKTPILIGPREDAALPTYGFKLPEAGAVIAEATGDAFRILVPPGAKVERCRFGEPFAPVADAGMDADKGKRLLKLSVGTAVRFTDGPHALVAYVAPPAERLSGNPFKGLPWFALVNFAVLSGALLAFVSFIPKQQDMPDFTAKGLAPVAVRLLAPEPRKKEEAKKKLEQIKAKAKPEEKKAVPDKVAEKAVKVVEKAVPKAAAAAPESKALKALAKLSAAGPAMNDLLAAVDKLGSGPGSKNSKATNYKLSGLIGKAPIANAGLGTFGLGGGGKGGGATLGAELLRGKGGGGIGAMGAGGVGKGAVGGTVSHATARSISVPQGSIDREAVAKVVNSHLQEVRACYERALLKDPSLSGKVVLEWGIGGSGSVISVKTKTSSLRNSAVESCIINELKRWTFPPPHGGSVLISYPFLFNSVGY